MAQITGKTVYVLGAGASQHTGAPLLRDFLVTARLLRERGEELRYRESFDRVFSWIDALRASSYYVEFDLDNLEHVFSLADMSRQLGLKPGADRFSDLTYLVTETLDSLDLRIVDGQIRPDQHYHEFVDLLSRLNAKRQEHTREAHGSFRRDVVITFNYDVMLDYALDFARVKADYCLAPTSASDSLRILKLHGSTNWAICRDCHIGPQVVRPYPVPAGYHIARPMDTGSVFVFKMVTNVLTKTECTNCKKKNTLEPVVIPPTWSKAVEKTPLSNVWKTAVEEIRDAFQMVVIGYSMPTTDTFFQYLLTLGLETNPRLHRIVVVNRSKSEDLRARYERVFARSFNERGRLKFLTKPFSEFVNAHMERVGSQVEWSEP